MGWTESYQQYLLVMQTLRSLSVPKNINMLIFFKIINNINSTEYNPNFKLNFKFLKILNFSMKNIEKNA